MIPIMSEMISTMLKLFRDGAPSYQAEAKGLAFESGDPQVSLENLRLIVAAGLMIRDILVKPTGVLVLFSTGEQYYAPGLRVGGGPATEALAEIASQAGFGPYERLLRFYRHLPDSYCGQLPNTIEDALTSGVLH
jgi:hypothetical protein